ncbi:MAG: flagellar hook-basal body complex protein FliE [Actinomycetota bacterium]|nr:flagellar hook-basal body complex protein FliE [Actinomycetota bacterium]
MAISGINPVSASGVSQLAQLWQQQVISGSFGAQGAGQTSGVGAASTAAGVDAAASVRSADFADAVGRGLEEVSQLDQTAKGKAVEAATGDLTEIHDYVIAATEAQTATELTTTVRNKALEAFNEIMRMQL